MPLFHAQLSTAPTVPLSVLGFFGLRVNEAQAQFLNSSIAQAAAAIVALVLTANILFTQLQTYALPARFLVLWDRGTKVTFALLATATLAPVVVLLLGWYEFSDIVVALFAASLVVLGWYIRTRPESVSIDRFFDRMIGHPVTVADSAREMYHMCLSALDHHDLDTFRKASLLLFSIDEPSDALYQFWNTVVERAQDEPDAVTPLAEAVYACASPIATTYVIGGRARVRQQPEARSVNPLYSSTLAEQSPHYLARLLLTCSDRSNVLVRQEVVENLVLLVLDLLATCDGGGGAAPPIGDATLATLTGYLDDADDEILRRVLSGDAIYHYLMFDLPGPERFTAGAREQVEAARRRAWNRIASHLYYGHGWESKDVVLLLFRPDAEGASVVRGAGNIAAVLGPAGADGLTCEWSPPKRGKRSLVRRR